jgi:tetratricopeptide (TPR) repeat protein
MRLAELSRTVDVVSLGGRIRAARLAAGLKQSDLAGDDVSAAYISRIEAGQRRPEVLLLERLAARLGVELPVLLEDPVDDAADRLAVRVDHAELTLMSGVAAGALAAADALWEDGLSGRPDLRRRTRQLRALALEAIGRTDEAIRVLEDVVAEPHADISWIKAVIALSRCYRETGDFARAISIGDGAADLIEQLGLAGTTEAIQLTVTVAGAYLERGDLAHALAMCERCIEDAEQVDSPVAKASAYWNASVIESERGNHGPALELAQKAMSLFELGEDSRNLGRLRTQVAFVQISQSPPDAHAAKATLDRAERELAWSSASRLDRARHRILVSKADLLLGDLDAADQHAAEARELVADQSVTLLSEIQAVTGQVHAAQGDLEAARTSYREAIESLSSVGIDRWVARLWFDLAGLLEQAGDGAAALDAYRRGATATGLADLRLVATNTDAQ